MRIVSASENQFFVLPAKECCSGSVPAASLFSNYHHSAQVWLAGRVLNEMCQHLQHVCVDQARYVVTDELLECIHIQLVAVDAPRASTGHGKLSKQHMLGSDGLLCTCKCCRRVQSVNRAREAAQTAHVRFLVCCYVHASAVDTSRASTGHGKLECEYCDLDYLECEYVFSSVLVFDLQ